MKMDDNTKLILPTSFTPIPELKKMFVEYNYDPETEFLKLHIWLNKKITTNMEYLRTAWELLATAFGHENVKWTPEVEHLVNDEMVKGSIFVGIKVKERFLNHIFNFIKNIDIAFQQNKNI
jgi:hypothetical protein